MPAFLTIWSIEGNGCGFVAPSFVSPYQNEAL
jgi:hypothetical protein